MSKTVFKLDLNIDLGEDDGRDFGSLFEAQNIEGRVVCGAGFAAVYNTTYRNDRMALQFFIRAADGDNTFNNSKLPPSTTDSGTYIFNCDGKLHAKSAAGDQSGTKLADIGHDPRDVEESRRVNIWDERTGRWQNDGDLDSTEMLKGDGKMRVAGKMLTWLNSTASCAGQVILPPPATGLYHHFFYGAGHLIFFHKDGKTIRLLACAWKPGQTIDVNHAKAITTEHDREFPFAMGQFRGTVLVSTNLGWTYVFDGEQWKVVHAWRGPGSYQLYSTIHWYDKLLLAHYPSGNLLDYDGGGGVVLEHWPPVPEGVSEQAREAQTTMIYGGDLWVGVWPWAEVWRYDADAERWMFVTRLMSHPELNDQIVHPYDKEVEEHNAAQAFQYQPNAWGQRCTGLAAVGDSLMASSSAKWPWPADLKPDFLTEQQRVEYAQITKLTVPGCLTVPLKWTGAPTRVSLASTTEKMTIDQDGKRLGELAISAELAERVRDHEVVIGKGVFGPFDGRRITID